MPASAILTFHSLDDSGSVVSYPPAAFAALLDGLAAARVPIVPLDRITQRPGAVALTFDDAFRNFYDVALPLLERHRMPATVFAVSAHTGGHNDWPTQSTGVPLLPLMSWNHLRDAARRSVTIGSHTVSHPYLDRLPPAEIARELRESRHRLEQELGLPVTTFAYPYGATPPDPAALRDAGYLHAVTTRMDYVAPASDALLLPRLDTYYLKNPALAAQPFSASCRAWVLLRALLRRLRQAAAPATVAPAR